LATNAYFGAIHPAGYRALDSFTSDPWPTWVYRFETCALQKEIVPVHGEHTLVVVYTLTYGEHALSLILRPLLAFREQNAVRLERGAFPNPWQISREFIECRPFDEGPACYIAHPDAKIETVGLWYRGFLYERDRESHLECVEDLLHPGHIEVLLEPGTPCSLIFSSPSPRPRELAAAYIESERQRRAALVQVPGIPDDPFFATLLRAADAFIYERLDGGPDIFPGLPWGECGMFRGLLAFAGLLLVPKRFDTARRFLERVARLWHTARGPFRLSPEIDSGQMHPADVPLWFFIAVWRYWRATNDTMFVDDVLVPVLEEIVEHYRGAGEVRCTEEGLLEIGHEPGASYVPVVPLGTNAVWYNAQLMLADLVAARDADRAERLRADAIQTRESVLSVLVCDRRAGLADSARLTPFGRDESLRASQVLAVGLPYCLVDDPLPVVELIRERLATPFGLRTLAPDDPRYAGDGTDVRLLPKQWSGSVDPTWFGCYCEALGRAGIAAGVPGLFAPFETELHQRGYGHISGAFAGDPPHDPCDYVGSASALAEVMRSYAREILHLPHIA
jgi:predicted glycogen debranching enzyme